MDKFIVAEYPPVPIVSFGGPKVGRVHQSQRYPDQSLIVGLVCNAFGYRRRDVEAHYEMEKRLVWAFRLDDVGEKTTEFQTADLSEIGPMWDPNGGVIEHGGTNANGNHLMWKEYWTDVAWSLALSLRGADADEIGELASALRVPARPLYLGRKKCTLGISKISRTEADGPVEALRRVPPFREASIAPYRVFYVAESRESAQWLSSGHRDWESGLHGGQVPMASALIDPDSEG